MSKKQTRKTYTAEFKLDIVNQSENCDNISKLATDLGLHPQLVYRWRREFKSDPERSFPRNGVEKQTPQEQKIAQLRRELRDVKTQRSDASG